MSFNDCVDMIIVRTSNLQRSINYNTGFIFACAGKNSSIHSVYVSTVFYILTCSDIIIIPYMSISVNNARYKVKVFKVHDTTQSVQLFVFR